MLETLYDGLDLEDFKAMMKDLYDKSEELIANINKAMEEKDAKGLFSFGHDLKAYEPLMRAIVNVECKNQSLNTAYIFKPRCFERLRL